MTSERTNPRTALITGASAGIGLDYAEFLAARGWNLVLTARREDRLQEAAQTLHSTHGVTCTVLPADLSEHDAPVRLMESIASHDIAVDALINNAGYGLSTTFSTSDWSRIEAFLEVMIGAVTRLPHLVLPGMLDRHYGRIVNIASLAAFAPEPAGSLYPAVKRYMVSMSRAIRLDVMNTGVHCTATCPGFTWTEFHDVLGNRKDMNKLPGIFWQRVRPVVEASWRGVERNRDAHVTGIMNKCIHGICHLLPTSLVHALTPNSVRVRGMHKA
ncbi:MAG: SDR family oxidoreductase [Phycisphaerales bacterium]|nr:SDR family oxidoreductase [Phycisphaerales bacterium]